MATKEEIQNSFLEQAHWCDELGSGFTAALLRKIAEDFSKNGIFFKLCFDWKTNPVSDALGLRICGGLHYLALNGKNENLKCQWPPNRTNWDIIDAFEAAKLAVNANFDWFKEFVKLPPQTNEVRRSAALFAGICCAIKNYNGPIDILELGASAGLNQSLDEFEYSLADFRSSYSSKVKIDTEWRAFKPNCLREFKIRNRAGCDQSPINVFNPQSAMLLQSYIWPDQIERKHRTEEAIEIAKKNNIRIEKQDAADWLGAKLQNRANDGMTIVLHSVFFNYPPHEVRKKIHEEIHKSIAISQANAPLVWLRFENFGSLFENSNSNEFKNSFVLDMIGKDYETGQTKQAILAKLDPHCRWIEWL